MSRFLFALVFVSATMLGARSVRAENCYPENLQSAYWERRDILATVTPTERNQLPTSRAVAAKWGRLRVDRRGNRMWGRQNWAPGDFEEFSVAYRSDELLFLRRTAWTRSSPARARKLDACLDRKKAERQAKRDEEEARLAADQAQRTEAWFEEIRLTAEEGQESCSNNDCRVMQQGVWVKVGGRKVGGRRR